MKKIDQFKLMPTEELTEKRNKLKKTMLIIACLMGAAFIFLIYTVMQTKNFAFLAIISGAALGLLPGMMQLKEMDNELKGRNQSQPIN